jgi:AraC-like DNA-binding protein
MTPGGLSMTERATPPGPRVWNTDDVGEAEAFDYYREGVCAAFMPLRPELRSAARGGFRSVVRSHAMPDGALNLVSARAHDVLRTRTEIAASPEPCWYINLQMDGICGITQAERTVALYPGQVGLFDSDDVFTLDHSRRAGLRVASLLVPKRLLPVRFAPGAHRLSDHPDYGALIAEAARSLVRAAESGRPRDGLHQLFLSLIALAACDRSLDEGVVSAGHHVRIEAAIRANAARAGWGLADCADQLGLAPRTIQRALARKDDTFSDCLARTRLARAAQLLRAAEHAHRSVSEIALIVGYSDAAPFGRAFRTAYGVSPGAWRKGDA